MSTLPAASTTQAHLLDSLGKLIVQRTIDANESIFRTGGPVSSSAQESIAEQKIPGVELLPLPICIIGAGCAGLYTAMILDTLGISYEILEANDRIGGRLFTHRFNGAAGEDAPVNDPARYDYVDMGAMRYPNIDSMWRVFELFHRLGMDDLLKKYIFKANNTNRHYNGVRASSPHPAGVDIFEVGQSKGGEVPDKYVAKGVDAVVDEIFAPFVEAFNTLPFPAAWEKLAAYDSYSTRGYMLQYGYPPAVIEWLETFQTATGVYDGAFVENTLSYIIFGTVNPTVDARASNWVWYCIDGGSDRLTTRMSEVIVTKPQLGVSVTGISSFPKDKCVKVSFERGGQPESKNYSQVISTVPLGCLAAINIPREDTTYMKRLAIRCLKYESSTKVALKFATRWWEDPNIMVTGTIKGGLSNSDLPIRTCVYPSYGFDASDTLPGVLLASYTLDQDAQRLGGLAQPEGSEADKLLIELTLRNLSQLHDVPIEKFGVLKDHFVVNWHQNKYARGAFAHFGPGQYGRPLENSMFASLKAPAARGKLHIAGEATSIHHGWVVGALNSAWRAVYNALAMVHDGKEKRRDMVKIWGIPDEESEQQLNFLWALGCKQII